MLHNCVNNYIFITMKIIEKINKCTTQNRWDYKLAVEEGKRINIYIDQKAQTKMIPKTHF